MSDYPSSSGAGGSKAVSGRSLSESDIQSSSGTQRKADPKQLTLSLSGGNQTYLSGNLLAQKFHRTMYDPVEYGLSDDFRLTKFSEMKGRGFKLPEQVLSKYLDIIKDGYDEEDIKDDPSSFLMKVNIGMDACVVPIRHGGLFLIQTVGSTYTLIDEPYHIGRIACASLLGDLYAVGVTMCNTILMNISVPTKMTDAERDATVPLMMRGFQDMAKIAGCEVSGGHTCINPWLSIGGSASSVVQLSQYIMPNNAVVGDVLVLTKPLGSYIAAVMRQWFDLPNKYTMFQRIKLIVSSDDAIKAYWRAIDSMSRLNCVAARLMHKYNAHGATDITSNGLIGHANTLAKAQIQAVSFVIHNLPIIAKVQLVARAAGNIFQLLEGHTPEISGGLLICLAREQAASFCKEIEKEEGYQAWIVGIVERGDRTARIIEKPRIIEVPAKEREDSLW